MAFGTNMYGYQDTSGQLQNHLYKLAAELIRRTDEEKAAIDTVAEFESRRGRLRTYFHELIGGLPEHKTPLHPEYKGDLQRDGYRIRRVVYQSLPGIYVTANLYVPEPLDGPAPAVLFTCGHCESGKATPLYQQVCIELVRGGMIVLAMDPVSQGERMQTFDPRLGRSLVRWHAEHTYLGLQCELAGSHIMRYFTWDIIRSIDYLCGLPEVDVARIGVTGNSGGGIQTIMAMIADDRVAAAAPCTYITSRESYMKTGQPQDGEQIWDGAIAAGMDYDDYLTLFAPKPLLVGAVESDFFGIEGMLASVEKAQKVYGLFDADSQLSLALVPGVHAFNEQLRRAVVRWFAAQWFGEERAGDVRLADKIEVEPVSKLRCTASGQVIGEYEDAVSVHRFHAERLGVLRERLAREQEAPDRMRERMLSWLAMPSAHGPVYARVVTQERVEVGNRNSDEAWERQSVYFFSESDIAVGGIRIAKAGVNADRCTVWLHDAGVDRVHEEPDWIHELLEKGGVLAFDPRGVGVSASGPVNGRTFDQMFGTAYKLVCDARMIGRPLIGWQVYDVLRAIDYIRQTAPGIQISIAGSGYACMHALLAGIADERVDEITLENVPPSFMDLAAAPIYKYDVRRHWYGVLNAFDLPELIQAWSGRKRIIVRDVPDVGHIVRW
ncbi:alpha/beta hydrolase family protein [Paenibacillus koleovorans]|uniref:alpha/beta hydrolase family protein n=1 Tax=Paenibacillus koleovorans TaxID=121608 RepID=UPI000FD9C3C5|nr:acetylxylan esterase [Paenibacillus koleovorans]